MSRGFRFRTPSSLLLLTAALALGSCDKLEFSPNDYRAPAEERALTEKNLGRLQQMPLPVGQDTLRFIFTGDSQRFYDEVDDLVASANQQPGISFFVVAGDISDFGFAKEMRWINEKLRQLKVPYVTVIGNHDSVGNGREAYKEIFGPLNYSFIYGDTKFIMVDTNGREYNFDGQVPNMPWLNRELSNLGGARRQVVISHVPPQDADFDPALQAPYAQALRETKSLVFQMNGHRHSSSITQPYKDGVWYVNADAFSERQYMVVSVWGDKQFRVKQIKF
ncbi:metallophosphoesterase family protein [Hymenobacter elongatus]|uniref:Metallophosphoesterase n=1 Tax=Hymenobacter elongatus TaxID=877208 RepID=A0A4Z0PIU1_9BACT|nr:metallophosphoesterase [Hymenobacter elongatus]TGE15070.1 metallophosphoesterase [Hymenobacter elongatus]